MYKITEKIVSNFFLKLSIVSIVLILALCINTFYWSDDYAFMVKLNAKGVIQNCIDGYYTWDGRFLTIGAFFQGFFLRYLPVQIGIFFWSCSFLASGFLMFSLMKHELKLPEITRSNKIIIGTLLAVVLWIGSYKHISETIYWATGGVYSFDLLLGAIWCLIFVKQQKKELTLINKVFFVVFSFVVGSTTQNLSIALITLILVTMLIDLLKGQRSKLFFYLVLSCGVLAGLVFVFIAPGNVVRMKLHHLDNLDFSMYNLVRGYVLVLIAYSKLLLVLIPASLVVAVGINNFIYLNEKNNFIFNFKIPNTLSKVADLLNDIKWLLVALSTITPFIATWNLASPRTSLFFMYFLELFVLIFISKLIVRQSQNLGANYSNKGLVVVLFLLLFLPIISFASYNLIKGISLKKVMTERENIMKKSEGKTIRIKVVDPSLMSPCYEFVDLPLKDEELLRWRRLRQEDYYHIKGIIPVK